MSEAKWIGRDAYEVARVDGTWLVLVRGGDWYGTGHEPAFLEQCRTKDKDEALRIRNALRATLEKP